MRVEFAAAVIFVFALGTQGALGAPKLDKETCDQLRAEKAGFSQAGVLADFDRGPQWGKANLSTGRLREIEHYILLDEQLKFGCREAVLTLDTKAVEAAARRIEFNADADPNAPPAEAGVAGGQQDAAAPPGRAPEAEKPAAPKRAKPRAAAAAPAAVPAVSGGDQGDPKPAVKPKAASKPAAKAAPAASPDQPKPAASAARKPAAGAGDPAGEQAP